MKDITQYARYMIGQEAEIVEYGKIRTIHGVLNDNFIFRSPSDGRLYEVPISECRIKLLQYDQLSEEQIIEVYKSVRSWSQNVTTEEIMTWWGYKTKARELGSKSMEPDELDALITLGVDVFDLIGKGMAKRRLK